MKPAWRSVGGNAGAVLASAVALGVILAHAGLAPAGQWQADEYFNFGLLRQLGGAFLRDRLLHWSPRPFSEALLYFYALAVDRLHRPLIGPFLLVCWSLPLAAAFAGFRAPRAGLANLVLPLCLFALLLLGHPVDELFYWPMGAAPYLACLSGIVFVSLRIVRGGLVSVGGRIAAAAALILSAGSAELGILFAACVCPVLAFSEVRRPGGWGARLSRAAIWLAPWLWSLGLLALLLRGRVTKLDPAAAAVTPLYHHLGASLAAAFRAAPAMFADGWTGAMTAVLACAGFMFCLAGQLPPRSRWPLAALAACLLATAFASIVAAFYQFGRLCCERHESFRQCLLLLALVAVAGIAANARRLRAPPWAGPVLLLGAMSVPLATRLPALAHDYAGLGRAIAARSATWRSAAKGGPAMTFDLPPKGQVAALGYWIGPGHYEKGAGIAWSTFGLLQYFGKTSVDVAAQYNSAHR